MYFDLTDKHPYNGIIGMNDVQVNFVLDEFDSKVKQVIANFENIPTNVAIYDPEGLTAQTIADSINKTKTNIETILSNITSDIKTYIETEERNLMLAKQQVIQNMNGESTITNV